MFGLTVIRPGFIDRIGYAIVKLILDCQNEDDIKAKYCDIAGSPSSGEILGVAAMCHSPITTMEGTNPRTATMSELAMREETGRSRLACVLHTGHVL